MVKENTPEGFQEGSQQDSVRAGEVLDSKVCQVIQTMLQMYQISRALTERKSSLMLTLISIFSLLAKNRLTSI